MCVCVYVFVCLRGFVSLISISSAFRFLRTVVAVAEEDKKGEGVEGQVGEGG